MRYNTLCFTLLPRVFYLMTIIVHGNQLNMSLFVNIKWKHEEKNQVWRATAPEFCSSFPNKHAPFYVYYAEEQNTFCEFEVKFHLPTELMLAKIAMNAPLRC